MCDLLDTSFQISRKSSLMRSMKFLIVEQLCREEWMNKYFELKRKEREMNTSVFFSSLKICLNTWGWCQRHFILLHSLENCIYYKKVIKLQSLIPLTGFQLRWVRVITESWMIPFSFPWISKLSCKREISQESFRATIQVKTFFVLRRLVAPLLHVCTSYIYTMWLN